MLLSLLLTATLLNPATDHSAAEPRLLLAESSYGTPKDAMRMIPREVRPRPCDSSIYVDSCPPRRVSPYREPKPCESSVFVDACKRRR